LKVSQLIVKIRLGRKKSFSHVVKKGASVMNDNLSVETQSRTITVTPKVKISEIDFGYHHVNESFVVYPGRLSIEWRLI
jgi:hypothetical protein